MELGGDEVERQRLQIVDAELGDHITGSEGVLSPTRFGKTQSPTVSRLFFCIQLESPPYSISAKICGTKAYGRAPVHGVLGGVKIAPIALQFLRRFSCRPHEASRCIKGAQLSLLSPAQLSPTRRSSAHVLSGAAHSSRRLLGRRKKSSPDYPRAGRRRRSGAKAGQRQGQIVKLLYVGDRGRGVSAARNIEESCLFDIAFSSAGTSR
ncbi:hypothetical protein KSP39_PZI011395 [Platanthera zijinensis]|uniref:Uncharacterized protein n=1 Tax=Platanthera zijinensis TaxID=2320716 RepID=A0AAP0G5D7_9ASPA